MGGGVRKPKKTGEERAVEIRQRKQLDEAIAESEEKFKALSRKKLGAQSILGNSPRMAETAKSAAPKSKYGKTKKVPTVRVQANEIP